MARVIPRVALMAWRFLLHRTEPYRDTHGNTNLLDQQLCSKEGTALVCQRRLPQASTLEA